MGHLLPPRPPEASAPRGLAASDAERVRKALAASLAENTRRAYPWHWQAFSLRCERNGYFPAPSGAETVAAHLAAIKATACQPRIGRQP